MGLLVGSCCFRVNKKVFLQRSIPQFSKDRTKMYSAVLGAGLSILQAVAGFAPQATSDAPISRGIVSLVQLVQQAGVSASAGISTDASVLPQAAPAAMPELQAAPAEQPVSSRRVAEIKESAIGDILYEEAAQADFDGDKLAVIISIESGGDPNAGANRPYKGLGQLNAAEWRKYGDGGNILDPRSNIRATIRSLQDKTTNFEKDYGREPSATELYMMHQQGEAGLRSHLKHPEWPAWKSMLATAEGTKKGAGWARRAIRGNVPRDLRDELGDVNKITSASFLAVWDSKLHGTEFKAPDAAASAVPPKPSDTEARVAGAG